MTHEELTALVNPLLERLAARNKAEPPDAESVIRKDKKAKTLWRRSQFAVYFRGSPNLPEGVAVGGRVLLKLGAEGHPIPVSEMLDAGPEEMKRLKRYAHGTAYLTHGEKQEHVRRKVQLEKERKIHGIAVSGSQGQRLGTMMDAAGDDPALKAAILKTMADQEAAKAPTLFEEPAPEKPKRKYTRKPKVVVTEEIVSDLPTVDLD